MSQYEGNVNGEPKAQKIREEVIKKKNQYRWKTR